jgi:hypothetical protein
MVFLPRHGRGHTISPSEINYKANVDALKRAGVTDLVSVSAVGSLKEELMTYLNDNGEFDIADIIPIIPKEITDDIVRLIANSAEALQDFAYIKTQQDINQFNVKYGVNLVLPQNT